MHPSFFVPESAPSSDQISGGEQPTRQPSACRGTLRRLGSCALALASCWMLSGCIDSFAAAPPPPTVAPPPPTNLVRREGVSPSGATVAMASLLGGTDGIRDSFTSAFDAAAKAQKIVMVPPATANYLVRGYLDAVPDADGTSVTYVLDIFDSKKHRTQRVEDHILVKTKAADPWSVVNDNVLAAVAAKSASALATVLTNTPEAIVAASLAAPDKTGNAAGVASSDEPGGHTVVAAAPPVGPPGNSASTDGLRRLALH